MNAAEALTDLKEISTEVEAAMLVDGGGALLASTLDEERSREIARLGRALLECAEGLRRRELSIVEVEVAMRAGSVLVVRARDRTIVATTAPEPATGLVLYDLRSCLRSLDGEPEGGARAA